MSLPGRAIDDVDEPSCARRLRVHGKPHARAGDDASESESNEDEETDSDNERDGRAFDGLELLREGRLAEKVVAYERSTLAGTSDGSGGRGGGTARDDDDDEATARRNPTMAAFLRMGGVNESRKRRRKGRQKKSARSKQAMEANDLMSDATILYARGEYAEAVSKLHAAIVKIPHSSEPYEQLALVYEETNDLEKALDSYSLATAVKRGVDPSMWYRMASLAVNVNNKDYAIHCLAKAARSDPHNYENKMDQATLYSELGDAKKAIEQLEWVLKDDLPPLDGAILRDAVVLLAKLYYSADMRDKAEHALEHMLKAYPQHIDATVVNILIELKIEFRKYSEVLEIVERSRANILEHVDSGQLPLDISVKQGQCLLYEGQTEEGMERIEELLRHKVTEFDDLYFDCGKTLMEVGLASKAEEVFMHLIALDEYDNVDMWQRVERCVQQSRGLRAVVEFYDMLHDKHPSDVFIAVSLADSLSRFQDDEESLRRARSLVSNLDDVDVQKYGILLRVTALQRKLLSEAELTVIIPAALKLLEDLSEKRSQRKLQRAGQGSDDFVDDNVRISDDDVFANIISGAEVAIRLGRHEEAGTIVNHALSFSAGSVLTREQTASLRYLKSLVAYMMGDLQESAASCRSVLEVFPNSVTVWNMLMHMAIDYPRALSVGTSKLAKRLVASSLDDASRERLLPLMASGYVHTWNKKWSIAMHDFLTALTIAPNDHEVNLCAAISLLHMATRNSNEQQRHALALRAVVLLERTAELNTTSPQEGMYNLARGLQHLGFPHLARPIYERCLEMPVSSEADDLRREAAYNLSLIYRSSNANGLARAILRKYMTV